MKTLYATFVLFLTISTCFGQNYQPFNESMSKRFVNINDASDDDYFFHADSTKTSGDSIIIHQYHAIQSNGPLGIDPSGCTFWGGTSGDVLDTTWLGNDVNWNSQTLELLLKNESNELINFDFSLAIGASSQFYTDGVTNYFIEHTSTEVESFLSVSDSVRIFSVQAFDLSGTPASSPLNNFEIRLSKNYGLLSFIDCYNFPSTQQAYEVRGQTNPNIGSYQLTYDECYPWQINDVLQYSSYHTLGMNGPPPNSAYQTITVIDRIETLDSVKLYFSSVTQETNPTTPISPYGINTSPLFFKKGTPISKLPWNMSQSDLQMEKATEDTVDHCGQYDRFKMKEDFIVFCDSCLCYGAFDGFGQTIEQVEYVKQYGIFKRSYSGYGPIQDMDYANASMIYSNINGIECGTFWNDIIEIPAFILTMSPNPTKDRLKIESDHPIENICLLDLSGRSILSVEKINLKMTEISLASFQKGAYILEVTANGSIQTRAVIRE